MFCEKCGNQITDGEKFCQQCGAPVPGQAPAPQQVQQAAQQAPEQVQQAAQQAPEQAQQYAPAPEQAQQYAPAPEQAQQYAPAPKAPRKPLSPMMKKIILFGGIGVAVLAAFLVVLFVVIVPGCQEAARIDITKYYTIKVSIDEEEENPSVLDGKINGSFEIDYEKFAKDFKVDKEKAKSGLDSLAGILEVKVTKDGDKASLKDAKADDVYTITVDWPTADISGSAEMDAFNQKLKEQYNVDFSGLVDSRDPKKQIEKIEKELGVEFKHKKLSREIKVADALEEQGVKIAEPTEMNVLGYIKDNNLFVQEGHRSGDISLSIKKFETSFGDYTVTKADDEYYSSIIVKKGSKDIGSFDVELSNHYYLKSNDKITVSYDTYDVSSLADKGIVLTGDEFTYTVVGPEEFTADVAKKNIEPLKTFFNDNVKKEDWKAAEKDQITLNNIYYSSNSDGNAYVVYVYTNTTQKYCKTMYMSAEYLYMEDGVLKNDGYCSTDLSGKDVKEAVSYCSYLKSPYTPTQIL